MSWRRLDGFKGFKEKLEENYHFIDKVVIEYHIPHAVILNIKISKELSWNEIKDLFYEELAVFMMGESVLNKIKKIHKDPLSDKYPDLFINLHFKLDNGTEYNVQFESSYYKRRGLSIFSDEDIQGYNVWSVWDHGAGKVDIPNGEEIIEIKVD